MADVDPFKVLVIEDDADTQGNLCDILGLDGYLVDTAGTVAAALGRENWSEYVAIIVDRKLPNGTAEELLPRLRQLAPEAAVIIATGYADLDGAIAAIRHGAADYILKPINPDVLRARLTRVSESRRLALDKRESEERFRHLVEAAGCIIVILRPDHSIAYFSLFAEELTGYSAADVMGKDYFPIFLPEASRLPVAAEIERMLTGGHATQGFENPVICKDGSCRSVLWNARALPNHDGGPAILAVGQDITNLKEAQEKIVRSERLAAIGQMMAGLAHESRNALQRSQACLEMLALDVQDRPEALEMVQEIQNAQDYLHHLYEEVRGYAAPIKPKWEPCHLGEVLDEVWLHLGLLREGRKAHLHQDENGLDLRCEIDRHSIGQVFRNVLENSLNACPDPVEVQATWSEAEIDEQPAVLVSLRDNGPGLTSVARRKIFDPFFTTKTQGTGLGMAIAKRIVEAHGGWIDVGHDSGRGAEILICLPRQGKSEARNSNAETYDPIAANSRGR